MIVVDTNHLDVLLDGGARGEQLAQRLAAAMSEHEITTTIVNVQEKVRGWLSLIERHNSQPLQQPAYYANLHNLIDFFSRWRILPFDESAAIEFGRLRKIVVGRIQPMDLRIASIALCHDAVVLTQNLRDLERIPRLRVEDWFPYSP